MAFIPMMSYRYIAPTQTKYSNVCVLFTSFIIPYKGGITQALSFACKTDRAGFKDWISYLTSKLTEKFNPNAEVISTNTYSLPSTWKS